MKKVIFLLKCLLFSNTVKTNRNVEDTDMVKNITSRKNSTTINDTENNYIKNRPYKRSEKNKHKIESRKYELYTINEESDEEIEKKPQEKHKIDCEKDSEEKNKNELDEFEKFERFINEIEEHKEKNEYLSKKIEELEKMIEDLKNMSKNKNSYISISFFHLFSLFIVIPLFIN